MEKLSSRTESVVVGFVLGILCPVSLFILFWWTAAALSIFGVLPIKVGAIITAAFAGLGIGIVLDIFFLKKWISRFYTADLKCLVLAYLFWSVVAVAFFMGTLVGNIALGTFAGIYVGRRQRVAGISWEGAIATGRNAGIFTASVTGLEALPIGLLALESEGYIAEVLLAVVGFGQSEATGPVGVGLIIILCLVLMVVQFWCTRTAARIAFRFGRNVVS